MPISLVVRTVRSCADGSFCGQHAPEVHTYTNLRPTWAGRRARHSFGHRDYDCGMISSSSLPPQSGSSGSNTTNSKTRTAVWSAVVRSRGGGTQTGGSLSKVACKRSHMLLRDVRSPQGTHMLLKCDISSCNGSYFQGSSPMGMRSAVMSTGTSPGNKRPRIRQATSTAAVNSMLFVRMTMPVMHSGCRSTPIPT